MDRSAIHSTHQVAARWDAPDPHNPTWGCTKCRAATCTHCTRGDGADDGILAAPCSLVEPGAWIAAKRRQARAADAVAAVAAGIGEYGIANEVYRLAGILRDHAAEMDSGEARRQQERQQWIASQQQQWNTQLIHPDDQATLP